MRPHQTSSVRQVVPPKRSAQVIIHIIINSMCICVYIYIYREREMYVYIYIYIYIYITIM